MDALEQLLIELDGLLCQQTMEKLLELIAHLKVKTSTEGKSKFKLINIIRAANTEALEAEGGPDGGVTPDEFVQDQIAFISNKPPPLEKDKAEEEMYELQKQLDALKMKQLKAIIKSISLHSSLTLPDRSLAKLRKVLRVFYQEKTAAELYQDLVNTCQQPKESAQ